jgi:hypothetical protein
MKVTYRRLVTHVEDAGRVRIDPEEDYGALMQYAWAGLDVDKVRDRIPKSINANRIAYPRGKAIVIDLIPEAPPVKHVTTYVDGSQELHNAIGLSFVLLRRAIENALDERLKLPFRRAVQYLDLFHPIVVVNKKIPHTRVERRRIVGHETLWIDLMSEVTFKGLGRSAHPKWPGISLADE